MRRRDFLKMGASICAGSTLPLCRVWAYGNGRSDSESDKLIVILLRGGVDGLNVVAPYADARYYELRPTIALQRSSLIDLDGHFGMHPAMSPLQPFWHNSTLSFVHASGSPDPSRSHFDAQDYMESGVPGAKNISTGWLNRLLTQLPSKGSPLQAISVGPVLPRIFSGPATVATVEPESSRKTTTIDHPVIQNAFDQMYLGRKDEFSKVYSEAVAAHREVAQVLAVADTASMSQEQVAANRGAPLPHNFNHFGRQLSTLFRTDPSVQVAFVDFGGWDTHINQGAAQGQLANHLSTFSSGLAELASGLGGLFRRTQIIVMSEFGRTAKENGNGGTDHGHGNVMWLMGAGVPGGKVYGRWAGLGNNALHESRDLPTSTDFRSVLSTLLADHMRLPKSSMANIFPGYSNNVDPFVKAS